MIAFLTALLVGGCVMLLVWYFGDDFTEKKMIERRIESIEAMAEDSHRSEEVLKKIDMKRKDARSHLLPGAKGLGKFIILIGWIVLVAVAVRVFRVPILNGVIIGGVLPILILRISKIIMKKKRKSHIEQEFPGALDLIVVCLEAGLSINAAFMRVAAEMHTGVLGPELKTTVHQMSAGVPLSEALRAFGKRVDIDEVRNLVASVIQAEKLGSSLALTFRVQADAVRENYRMKMREKIQKLPIKIIFPLALFIFPTLFIIILGPAMVTLTQTLGGAA